MLKCNHSNHFATRTGTLARWVKWESGENKDAEMDCKGFIGTLK